MKKLLFVSTVLMVISGTASGNDVFLLDDIKNQIVPVSLSINMRCV